MGLDALLATMERRAADTPDTPCNPIEVSAKPAPIKACTLDTPDTSQISNSGNDALKVGTGDTATDTSWGWLLHYPGRDPVEVYSLPESTHAEMLRDFPGAIAAEQFKPSFRQPTRPMTADEETAIREWLATIEETDPYIIADVLERCRNDADARDYFIRPADNQLNERK